ncbi:hypothetical protein GCM10010145_33960 [Streptomyces ruber]|uniref:Uncharacterized protein n=1 Tax=Streptomyces ruber TaxID=83378 RepID=A0A918ERC6_9ACTN|nr:hypothetical protein GCM10010145_33960 [Streptomyces ruber]
MRRPTAVAHASDVERERLRSLLRDRGQAVVRAARVLLSPRGLSPAQIAALVCSMT